jgi:hypothetical protein
MAVLVWDDSGNRLFETGIDKGVLYPIGALGTYLTGYAWNGLISFTESPSGAEPTPLWADNIKYLNLISAEEFSGTLEAYTYPDEFAECDGSKEAVLGVKFAQQPRKVFGLSFRTKLGNDVDGEAHGYKLHLLYGCQAAPSEKAYQTVNDSPEAITFSWEISATPPALAAAGLKPTSLIVIDSTVADAAKLTALETILYGAVATEPRLPLPDEIITLMTP